VGYPLAQRVTDAWCVIEPDFGNKGFGHPDMAAYVAFDAGDPLVLLLEAKLATYEKSSWPNTRRQDSGFNSKINGQIELNHRLALALTSFDADAHTKLAEPGWILDTPYDLAVPGTPRHVKKPTVLDLVARRLAGLPLERYIHAVITTDEAAPWAAVAEDRRPAIWLARDREDWTWLTQRLYWTSWERLYALAEPWQPSGFRRNYEFFRNNLRRRRVRQGVVDVSPRVGLVILHDNLYRAARQTYLHLSWDGQSFKLRDYSGPELLEIRPRFTAEELFREGNIVHTIWYKQRERHRWQDYEWWHEQVVQKNQERWPDDQAR
jgi:hypothetical protein